MVNKYELFDFLKLALKKKKDIQLLILYCFIKNSNSTQKYSLDTKGRNHGPRRTGILIELQVQFSL